MLFKLFSCAVVPTFYSLKAIYIYIYSIESCSSVLSYAGYCFLFFLVFYEVRFFFVGGGGGGQGGGGGSN